MVLLELGAQAAQDLDGLRYGGLYDIDLLGEKKIVNNLEAHLGLSIFF